MRGYNFGFSSGLYRPILPGLGLHIHGSKGDDLLFPVNADFNAWLKLDDKLVKLGFRGGLAKAPADVADKGIVGVAIIVGKIAKSADNRRTDQAF